MKNFKDLKESRKLNSQEISDELIYSSVPGKENVIRIYFYDENGKKQSTLVETFSDKQFELIDKLKKRLQELRERSTEIEKELFSV